ncbi:MAG TPA: acetate/propionate family kinase, partial [Thermodesulfobacteriota bacterium]|nr:acetate/propionate family kinase [Thermodesulfobacteriota bacterium]
MADRSSNRILTINSGSSSIKFSLYDMGKGETGILQGEAKGIGLPSGSFRVEGGSGPGSIREPAAFRDHASALNRIVDYLRHEPAAGDLSGVGHRLVHGGRKFIEPHLITVDLIRELNRLIPLAPDHLPHEIEAVRSFRQHYPRMKNVACFDTAFHTHMPGIAKVYPLPRGLRSQGILRYGFHGLSFEYITSELKKGEKGKTRRSRIIVAHLGNGASMAALRGGRSVDTTMGFSPAGGLVMSTRTGDLDPGVLLYLFKEKSLDLEAVNHVVNKEGGLLGISGVSPAMEELLRLEAKNKNAAEAVDLFCYQARKFLGSLAAVLGGLDLLVFTGGIGENAPAVRARICSDLGFLGIRLDPARNRINAPRISL